jgi:long-subunit fatty acid transport protein
MKKVLLTLALAAFAFAANAQFVVSGQLGFNTNGGSTYTKTEVGVTNETKIPNNILNTITFAPSFGYMLNDNMQVGLSFGLGYRYTKTFNTVPPIGEAYTTPNLNAENWTSVSQMNFNIAPYFRYYFAEAANFKFFCEASIFWTINGRPTTHLFATKIDADPASAVVGRPAVDTTYRGTYVAPAANTTINKHTETDMALGINIVPGVNYKFNDHFSADLYLNLVAINFTHSWQKEYLETTTNTPAGTLNAKFNDRARSNSFNFGANFNNLSINDFLNFRLGINYHF